MVSIFTIFYNYEYKYWSKHKNAGNDHIPVSNYPDIGKKELIKTLGGIFPQKETDFMKHCHPSELCIRYMLNLLKVGEEKGYNLISFMGP